MNKTVCHLSFNHGAFDDRIYWKEALSLKEAGYNVIHIAVSEKDSDFISKEGVRVIEIKRRTKHANIYVNRLLQFLFKKGSTIEVLYEKAVSLQADIYHYHDLQLNAISKRLKNLSHRPKVIYDAHEAYHLLILEAQPKHHLSKIIFWIYAKLVERWEIKNATYCDHIIVTDEFTKKYFKSVQSIIPVTTLYNYSFFKGIERTQEKKYHFIYTGLMSESRGIEEIIQATNSILKERNDIKVLLIGPFETQRYQTYIDKLVSSKQLQNNIIIKEEVSFREISQHYSEAMIGFGLFHKTPKYTTFIPIKLFEYMAFGLPVIFSDHGPSADIIKQADCGILVDYKDINAIVDSMKKLLRDPVLYNMYSQNGRKQVAAEYNWQMEKNKLLTLYQSLLD